MIPRLLLLASLLTLAGCDSRRAGGGDDDDSGLDLPWQDDDDDVVGPPSAIDLLIVMDNSNSMAWIQDEMRASFGALVGPLQDLGVSLQLGVTTTDLFAGGAGNSGILRGVGPLGGSGCGSPAIIGDDSSNFVGEASSLLDVGVSGSGEERGAQAAVLALCRAQDAAFWDGLSTRPDDDPVRLVCQQIPPAEQGCNVGLLRADAATAVLIVSDEGDDSHRNELLPPSADLEQCVLDHNADPSFGECDCRMAFWTAALQGLGATVFTVGPSYQVAGQDSPWCDGSTRDIPGPCNPFGSAVCAVDFYQLAACQTGGAWWPVESTAAANECDVSDFGLIASELSAALQTL